MKKKVIITVSVIIVIFLNLFISKWQEQAKEDLETKLVISLFKRVLTTVVIEGFEKELSKFEDFSEPTQKEILKMLKAEHLRRLAHTKVYFKKELEFGSEKHEIIMVSVEKFYNIKRDGSLSSIVRTDYVAGYNDAFTRLISKEEFEALDLELFQKLN